MAYASGGVVERPHFTTAYASPSLATQNQVNAGFAGYGRVRDAQGNISYVDKNGKVVGSTNRFGVTTNSQGAIVQGAPAGMTYSYKNLAGETITGSEESVRQAMAADYVKTRMADAARINAAYASQTGRTPTAGDLFATQQPPPDNRMSGVNSQGVSRYGREEVTTTITGVQADVNLPLGIFRPSLGERFAGQPPINPYKNNVYAVSSVTSTNVPPTPPPLSAWERDQARFHPEFFQKPLTSAGNFLINRAGKMESYPAPKGQPVLQATRYLGADVLRGTGEHPVATAVSVPAGFAFGNVIGGLGTAATESSSPFIAGVAKVTKVGLIGSGIVLGGIQTYNSANEALRTKSYAPIIATGEEFGAFGYGYNKGITPFKQRAEITFSQRFGGRPVTPETAKDINTFRYFNDLEPSIQAQRVERVNIGGRTVSDALGETTLANTEPVLAEPETFPNVNAVPKSDYYNIKGGGVGVKTTYGYSDMSVPATENPPGFTTTSKITPIKVDFVTTAAEAQRLATPTTFLRQTEGNGQSFINRVGGSFTISGVRAGVSASSSGRTPEAYAPFYHKNYVNSKLLGDILDITIVEEVPRKKGISFSRTMKESGKPTVLKPETLTTSGNGGVTVLRQEAFQENGLTLPTLEKTNKLPGYDFMLEGRRYRNVFGDKLYIIKPDVNEGVRTGFRENGFEIIGGASKYGGLATKKSTSPLLSSRFTTRNAETTMIGFNTGTTSLLRTGSKTNQGFILATTPTTNQLSASRFATLPITNQVTRPFPQQILRSQGFSELITSPASRTLETPPVLPFGFPAMVPPFGGEPGRRTPNPKRSYNYAPSLTALFTGERTSKRMSAFTTGLTSRPVFSLATRKRRRKK